MKFLEEDLFLVTGASSGIGREIALKLNELGARVIATGRDTKRLMETQQLAKLQTKIYTEAYDLTENIEEIPNFIKTLKEKYGKFKGLICAAGVDITQTTQMINLKDMEKIFKINYQAPMFLAKAFCDKRNNIGESASLLFIASIAGVFPDKGQIIYGASKAALIASMKSISKEISIRKIRCNSISPAWIDTPMFNKYNETIGTNLEQYNLGIGKPSDVASLAAFLVSDEARWITGQNYILEGGVSNGKYI